MRDRRLLLTTLVVALWAPMLGCINCGGDPEPPSSLCTSPDAPGAVTVSELRISPRIERGGQGTQMLITEVTWIGESPPACAEVTIRALDPADGTTEWESETQRVQTQPIAGGSTTVSAPWFPYDGSRPLVEVTSYGLTVTENLCEDCGGDAGPTDAGPTDGGATDSGGPDAADRRRLSHELAVSSPCRASSFGGASGGDTGAGAGRRSSSCSGSRSSGWSTRPPTSPSGASGC